MKITGEQLAQELYDELNPTWGDIDPAWFEPNVDLEEYGPEDVDAMRGMKEALDRIAERLSRTI